MTKPQGEMPELLPCPFCGSPAEFDERVTSSDKLNYLNKFIWHVGCSKAECVAYCLNDSFDRKTLAAEAWNTRASPPPQPTAQVGGARIIALNWLKMVQPNDTEIRRTIEAALRPAPVVDALAKELRAMYDFIIDRGYSDEDTDGMIDAKNALDAYRNLTKKG
jgi:hypothetical protein